MKDLVRIREWEWRAAWMQASERVRTGWGRVEGESFSLSLIRRWRRVGRVVRITHFGYISISVVWA